MKGCVDLDWPTKIEGPVAAIGDLHGRLDLLDVLLEKLANRPDWNQRWLVFLGDYVDRGRYSRGVINRIIELRENRGNTTAVLGNHDLAMAAALALLPQFSSAEWSEDWIDFYDAEATFLSYGVKHNNLEQLRTALPVSHVEFLKTLPWMVEHPEFVFVHAGMDPALDFTEQLESMAARQSACPRPPWLCSKEFHLLPVPDTWPKTVVQGHVVQSEVIIEPKKILLDTSGGFGPLSCVLLPEREIISTARDPRGPIAKRRWWSLGSLLDRGKE